MNRLSKALAKAYIRTRRRRSLSARRTSFTYTDAYSGDTVIVTIEQRPRQAIDQPVATIDARASNSSSTCPTCLGRGIVDE